jgi:hypothetical protein
MSNEKTKIESAAVTNEDKHAANQPGNKRSKKLVFPPDWEHVTSEQVGKTVGIIGANSPTKSAADHREKCWQA